MYNFGSDLNKYYNYWAVTFIPTRVPRTVCRTNVHTEIVQLEVCKSCSGRGMCMDVTAPLLTWSVYYLGKTMLEEIRCTGILQCVWSNEESTIVAPCSGGIW